LIQRNIDWIRWWFRKSDNGQVLEVPPLLPRPRGPLSEHLRQRLTGRPGQIEHVTISGDDSNHAEDVQLALHLCYGLHYDGFSGVDDAWEWDPSLARFRSILERRFLEDLIGAVPRQARPGVGGPSPLEQLRELLAPSGNEPSLSQFMVERGTLDQFREFVIHRSIYQRKEADAHTWAIPRLRGRAKTAIVRLQSDEYGNGVRGKAHADLFANTMLALGLNPAPGAYIDQIPGVALATDNLVTMLGRYRRWRGALVGHLAVFEMTSVLPMSRYATALRRMQVGEEGLEFYDVHVEADVLHAQIAADDLIGGMTETDRDAARDIPFGAASLLVVESRFSSHLLGSWGADCSSLWGSKPHWQGCVSGRLPAPNGQFRAPVAVGTASAN
jgi:Iron-containing redox enzyme